MPSKLHIPNTRGPSQAFSLTEMLVVIGIVGVLFLLAIPSVKTIQERSKAAKCASNIRSVGSTLLAATREQGPTFNAWCSGSTGAMWNTMMIVDGYLTRGELKTLSCPSIQYADASGSISGRHYGIYMGDSEGKMEPTVNELGQLGTVYKVNVRNHPAPSKSIFLVDSVTKAGIPSIRAFPGGESLAAGGIHARHGNLANLFFLDGHVEAANESRMYDLGVRKIYTQAGTAKDLDPSRP